MGLALPNICARLCIMAEENTAGSVRIRLGVVAVASLLVTVAALTTLVIVVAIRDADLLSVVALALAIIAFSAQLIIYIVQAADSAAATRQTLELHAQLAGLLAELRERTGTTQKSMDAINSQLLGAIIGKFQASSSSIETGNLAEQVAETYAEVSRGQRNPYDAPAEPAMFPPPLPTGKAQTLHRVMAAWPSEAEIGEISEELNEMSAAEVNTLYQYAMDMFQSTKSSARFGPGLSGPADAEARLHGLVEKVPGWDVYALNDEGMRLGRIFTALGTPPPGAESVIPLREEIRRNDRVHDRRSSSSEQ